MMDELQQRLSRLSAQPDTRGRYRGAAALYGTWPPVNLYDTGAELLLRALIPGMTEEDVTVSCNQGVLTIAGERKPDLPEGYRVHRQERGSFSFSRSFSFPVEVDLEKTSATVKNGILTVTVGKAEKEKPRQIQVRPE